MDISVNVNSKAIEKLLDVVAEGIGATANHLFEFDAKKIKRIGDAEAEVEKQRIIKKAEATEGALEIFARAEKRFLLEQFSKQINLENIIVLARDRLGESEVSEQKVDPDWSRRFVSIAQDVSREDMQNMLASILAGEVKQPTTFSLRTLDFVKNLASIELKLFEKIVPFATSEGYVHATEAALNHGFAHISYSELMELMELDFIKPSLTSVRTLAKGEVGKTFLVNMKAGALLFEFTEDIENIEFPIIQLTRTAIELVPLIGSNAISDVVNSYTAELVEFYVNKKLKRIEL